MAETQKTVKIALGEKSSFFVDSRIGVKITKGHFVEIPVADSIASKGRKYNPIVDALKGGSLIKVSTSDIEELGLLPQPVSQKEQKLQSEEEKNRKTPMGEDEDEDEGGEKEGEKEEQPDFEVLSREELIAWADDQEDSVVSPEDYSKIAALGTEKEIRKELKRLWKKSVAKK